MDNAWALKLLRACNLAYLIHAESTDIAPGPEADALIAAIGTKREAIQVSVHGANLIDACLFAKTGDGDGILAFRGTLPPAAAKGTIDDLFAVARDWLQDAEAALRQALALDLHNPRIANDLAAVLMRMHRHGEAHV